MPFLVSVDFSSNKLSGAIPPSFSNCSYLNELVLSDNELFGTIPYEFGSLSRLKKLSVANNRLSGMVPASLSGFSKEGFEGNIGLCGSPLESMCGEKSEEKKVGVIVGAIVGAGVCGGLVSLVLSFGFYRCSSKRMTNINNS